MQASPVPNKSSCRREDQRISVSPVGSRSACDSHAVTRPSQQRRQLSNDCVQRITQMTSSIVADGIISVSDDGLAARRRRTVGRLQQLHVKQQQHIGLQKSD